MKRWMRDIRHRLTRPVHAPTRCAWCNAPEGILRGLCPKCRAGIRVSNRD